MTEPTLSEITAKIRDSETGPFYLIDFDGIENSIMRLKSAFDADFKKVRLAYSFKTNSLHAITTFMHSKSMGAEVVSGQELEWALSDNFEPNNIYFDGPVKSKKELQRAAELNINIQVDSVQELIDLLEITSDPSKLKVGARLSMPYKNKINSRFGLTRSEFKEATTIMKRTGISFSGLHLHSGSNITNINQYRESIMSCIDCITETWHELSWIDFGGGFPANTALANKSEELPTPEAFSSCIKSIISKNNLSLNNKTVVIEPGRCLVEDNGLLLARVEQIKKREGRNIVVTNAGLNLVKSMHSWCHPVIFLRQEIDEEQSTPYEVYGCNCFESDLIIDELEGPSDLKIGDWIAIGSTGGYDMQNYNAWTQPYPSIYGSSREGIKKLSGCLSPRQMRQNQHR